jgi:hypothetical protein
MGHARKRGTFEERKMMAMQNEMARTVIKRKVKAGISKLMMAAMALMTSTGERK